MSAQNPASATNPTPATPPGPEPIPLGDRPRPTGGADLVTRLRASLVAEPDVVVQHLDAARIDATLDGADIASLDADLTGVTVVPAALADAGGAGGPATPAAPAARPAADDVVAREPGTLRRLRVEAHPLTVVDLPVDVSVNLDGLPYEWVEDAGGGVGLLPVEPGAGTPVTGDLRLAVARHGLVATVRGVLAVVLQQQGITLTGLDIDIVSEGPRAVRLRVDASVKKGMFLSASVQALAAASVDTDLVLTVGDVRLTSQNPLVAAMLGAVRGRVDAMANRRIDLGAQLPDGVRVADVRLAAGDRIVLTARLA